MTRIEEINHARDDSAARPLSRRSILVVNIISWLKLDMFSALQMLKGGLPPVIVLSMYQATSVAEIEYTLGYLAAILAVSAQCLLPRAKFIKITFFSVVATCFGATLSCIAVVCCVSVRQYSDPSNNYNSSASVVSAVWLLFGIWFANALRAHRPAELQDPMVALSIFLVVALTTTPTFVTVVDGLVFVRRLLITFLIGLSVASGVSLLIVPITSRRNVFKALNAYARNANELFESQVEFVRESASNLCETTDARYHPAPGSLAPSGEFRESLIATKLNALGGVISRIDAELTYTRVEVAWGKLFPEDFIQIHDHLSALFLSLAGLSMLPEISQMMTESVPTQDEQTTDPHDTSSTTMEFTKSPVWRNMFNGLEKRLASTQRLVGVGLKSAFDILEISQSQSKGSRTDRSAPDLERLDAAATSRASEGSQFFYSEIAKYRDRRENLHRIWPSLMFPTQPNGTGCQSENDNQSKDLEVREHLLVFLFMEQLQNEALQAVHDLLSFAEDKVKKGAMHRNKLIFPSQHLGLMSPLAKGFHHQEMHTQTRDSSLHRPWTSKDAEHSSPTNWWERASDNLRILPRMLNSTESKFGARVAMASVSVAILAYIRQTHTWFTEERVIWVMVVIVIGMKVENGASTFGYVARIGGTTISLILSLIVWYIADGHTAGVIVFLYIANVLEYYFWVRFPQLLGPCTIMIVTLNVIIGYELQVKKLGLERATSNGQPYLPVYIFGPYKLLCVIIAVTISFFWTIFPSSASARSQVRRKLGQGLFLLANFYSCMHRSIKLWVNERQGDTKDPTSIGRQLLTLNKSLFCQQVALITQNLSLIHWTSYEIPLGGKFPRGSYISALSNVRMLTTCLALMTHATRDIESCMSALRSSKDSKNPGGNSEPTMNREKRWIHQLARATESSDFDAHTTTSILCHLAGSISSNSALPPYLSPPSSFLLAQKLREINSQAMQIDNIRHPDFSAFASIEVIASLMNKRIRSLIGNVKNLVGEIDFDIDEGDKKLKGSKSL